MMQMKKVKQTNRPSGQPRALCVRGTQAREEGSSHVSQPTLVAVTSWSSHSFIHSFLPFLLSSCTLSGAGSFWHRQARPCLMESAGQGVQRALTLMASMMGVVEAKFRGGGRMVGFKDKARRCALEKMAAET